MLAWPVGRKPASAALSTLLTHHPPMLEHYLCASLSGAATTSHQHQREGGYRVQGHDGCEPTAGYRAQGAGHTDSTPSAAVTRAPLGGLLGKRPSHDSNPGPYPCPLPLAPTPGP